MGFLKAPGTLLHVGCGSDPLPSWLQGGTEIRLDVVGDCAPDIVANMVDMGNIGEFDTVLCRHALEHLPPHDVGRALREFKRVLKTGGAAIVFVPDLEGVAATNEVLFDSPAGPISGLDLLYGFRPALEENPFMAHRCGFVQATLQSALTDAGFAKVATSRMGNYDLMGVGIK